MNTRCKPGDLAVVVQAQNSSNLGLIVRVCGPYAQDANFAVKGVLWLCECSHPMTWVRSGKTITAFSGPIPDMLLQPIRGIGTDDSNASAKGKSEPVTRDHSQPA